MQTLLALTLNSPAFVVKSFTDCDDYNNNYCEVIYEIFDVIIELQILKSSKL